MARIKEGDIWRWLSVSEASLLLHSDLNQFVGHVPLPTGVGADAVGEEEMYGLPVLDGKTPEELVSIITRECSVRSTTYTSLMEYRYNALKELWTVLAEREKTQNDEKHNKTVSSSGGGAKSTQKGEGFASRVSLVLIFPVLKSLCKIDPALSQETAGLLLESLQSCDPLSLSNEPSDCINGLENILCSWLKAAREDKDLEEKIKERQLQTAASALVALAVAVGTGRLLLRTVQTLQTLESLYSNITLIVHKILHKLLQEHIVYEEPSALMVDNHITCWSYEVQNKAIPDGIVPRSILCNNNCLYVTTTDGEELLKLGTGRNGTLRGYIYNRCQFEKGWIAGITGCNSILYKKMATDNKPDQPFLSLIDCHTLKVTESVQTAFTLPTEQITTLNLISDGQFLYWLYYLSNQDAIHPLTGEKVKQHLIYVQILLIEEREASCYTVVSAKNRILLSKPINDDGRPSNDVMKSFIRSGGSSFGLSALLGGAKDDIATSCGLGLKQIQNGSVYCTGSSLVLISSPPPNTSGSRSLFGVTGNTSSKALCYSFCYSLSSGLLVSQSDLPSSSQLHCGLSKGGSVQSLAICYDPMDHCLWCITDDYIDVWTCVGKVKPAAHLLALRMGKPCLKDLIPDLPDSDTITITDAILLLLRHSGIMSCRLTPARDISLPVRSSSMVFLDNCCNILEYSLNNNHIDNCLSMIITLEAVLPSCLVSTDKDNEDTVTKSKNRIRSCISRLLELQSESSSLYSELKKLICHNCDHLYFSNDEDATHFMTLLSPAILSDLTNDVLIETAARLKHSLQLSPAILRVIPLIENNLEHDSLVVMATLDKNTADSAIFQPVFSPSLQCASSVFNLCLRSLSIALDEYNNNSTNSTMEQLETRQNDLVSICDKLRVFELCGKTLDHLLELANANKIDSPLKGSVAKNNTNNDEGEIGNSSAESSSGRGLSLNILERVCKGTVLGVLLPPLLATLSNGDMCSQPLATHILKHLTTLARQCAELCSKLYKGQRKVQIPAPWASGRTVETTHPVRDNYKFKEVVSFPGAKHLYLKFDPRCSSQYDYDKVLVYAGDSTSSPKVAEYGGNTHGFGSRSVLGKGWPKELVKVDGDEVMFAFEMKSGREHSTPDKAMWGFACTVRPQEIAEDTPLGLPFLQDLYLSVSSVCCSLIGQLFDGVPPTEDEQRCRELMKSSLLQRCVWSDTPTNIGSPASSSKSLLPTVLEKIRTAIKRPRPVIRQSISVILQIDLLEDVILSTCLKHHGITSPLSILADNVIEENQQLLEDIFSRINGLERRLQALAELESKWLTDINDIIAGTITVNDTFFHELYSQESLIKSFELLCCLMEVDYSKGNELAIKELQSLMEKDVQYSKDNTDPKPSKIKLLVNGVIERSKLLLQVNIDTTTSSPYSTHPSHISRSTSVPAHRHDNRSSLRRQRSDGSSSVGLLVDTTSSNSDQQSTMLNEIFQFIGTKPEEAVSSSSFLLAASQQRQRAIKRVQALEFLQSILTSEQPGATVEHILGCVSRVLYTGPHVTDIACSGLVNQVRDAFANVMLAVVELASLQPVSCINTITLLSIIPYTHEEESCLVRSGLVKLLDHLCSLSNLPNGCDSSKEEGGDTDEDAEALQRVAALAWAAFQVLADRCVSWETHSRGFLSSGLAQQVSLLLTNHLSRAMDTLVTSESGTSETLQEALSMLLGLARSHMGRTILSQPACVSKLLLLLTDQRPSPKLVLIALQLCRIALPLMTIAECAQVTIPHNPTFSSSLQSDNLASNIITLLMAKLAEYLIPNLSQHTTKQITDSLSEENTMITAPLNVSPNEMDENGQASVYIYKRKDENAGDLLQLLINQDPRQRSLDIDSFLKEEGRAEIYTDTYRSCFRRAQRWANMGFLVSIESPVGGSPSNRGGSSGTESDIRKVKAESYCKKKNIDLLKTDPPRPFLSGTVAYSLAAEIIGLLNGLLADHGAAQVWRKAIQNVLQTSLEAIPSILPELEKYCITVINSVRDGLTPPTPDKYLSVACLANATFAALGGFKDLIRPNMRVLVSGDGIEDCTGTVISISERRGVANVQFNDDQYCFGSNCTLEVPLSRLTPPEIDSLSICQLNLQKHLCDAMVAMVTTHGPTVTDPHSGMDASLRSMGLCRLFAELRSRAFMCLSHHVKEESFRNKLLNKCNVIEFVKQTEGCQSGDRLSVIETHCLGLRMLYRDCARPPAPKVEKSRIEHRKYQLDITRCWPPVKSCSFSHNITAVMYQGPTTSTGGGVATDEAQDKPKGAFIMTTDPIPRQAPSFYWEVELTQVESDSLSPHLTMGYCPNVIKGEGEGAWSYPDGTCLLRSSGRGCQVLGDDRMKWKKINHDTPLKTGDIMGCGWIKEDTTETKGVVYFTINGIRIQQQFKDGPINMYPFLQLQKKGIRVKVNFGEKSFAYAEGHAHRDAADVPIGDTIEEIVALFRELPFHPLDDDDEDDSTYTSSPQQPVADVVSESTGKPATDIKHHEPLVIGPPTKDLTIPKLFSKDSEYVSSSSMLYPLRQSFDTMIESGPLIRPGGGSNHEEEDEEGETRGAHAEEDLHALLVKAWETKVFPKIQRRFRNDQERKSGLEQIKGALQLGMETIAQETVEFLYEENGGLPKDLYFPTIDDVKTDLEKFTINRVKKGSAVVILKDFPYARCGVRAMQKTQGLTGIVLSIDDQNELVQVECYIPSDGALVRFWYPVLYLERPPKGYRKPSALRGAESVNILVHRELLKCELSLSAMYCRSCLITLHTPSVTQPSPIPVPTFLSLVAAHSLSQPSVEGMCVSTSSTLSPSLSNTLSTVLSSPQNIFYFDHTLIESICHILLNNPPKDLVYIISEICTQMGSTVEGCGYGEYLVPDGRDTNDVYCSKGSFMVVSSLEEKQKSDIKSSYKYPWGKVFIYRGGQGKAGQKPLQEVIRYPNEIPQSTTHQYCGPIQPCFILPTNRIHLKIGGCSPHPGRKISVVGVSELLPLVMSVSDILSRKLYDTYCVHNKTTSNTDMYNAGLSYTILPLIKTLCRMDCPPVLKEKIFQTLSNSLWTLSHVQSIDSSSFPVIPAKFLTGTSHELEQLYELETATFSTNKNTKFPPEGLICTGGQGKFSTYFQILLELVLACQHYTTIYHQATPTLEQKKSTTRKESVPIKNKSWLKYVTRIVDLLQRVVKNRPINREFYNLFRKSLPIKAETKLLVLTGLNPELEKHEAIDIIANICNRHGGITSDGIYMPCITKEVPVIEATPTSDGISTLANNEKLATHSETTSTTAEKTTPQTVTKSFVCGRAVLELQCSEKTSVISSALLSGSRLLGEKKELSVSCVSNNLKCGEDSKGNEILREYLYEKLFEGKNLNIDTKTVLSDIFNMACYNGKVLKNELENKTAIGDSYLKLLMFRIIGSDRDIKKILPGMSEGKKGLETINEVKLIEWIEREAKKDVLSVWCGLLAAGYDFHFNRCGFLPSDACLCSPDSSKDHALALHVDTLCRKLGVVSTNLQPWDVIIADTELTANYMTPLQNMDNANITLRFLQLRQFNRQFSWLLPLIDLCSTHPSSLGSFLSCISNTLFYDTKISLLHSVLNSTTRRSLDQAPPEIRMDPLETIEGLPSSVLDTQYCQAARQMLTIPSSQLCVSLASGGDPTYAFNVKLSGEEVHGTSGSFRHFLWQIVKELQSSLLPILILCPSHSAGINKGKHILVPGTMNYSEEKLLEFFGQLLGVAIRADVPVAIDMLDCFWKSVKEEELLMEDLKEADSITYNITKNIIEASDESLFYDIVSGIFNKHSDTDPALGIQLRFTYQSLKGIEEEMCEGGFDKELNFSNRVEYANAVRQFRLNELSCRDKMVAIRCGMASVIPIQVLRILTANDLNLRVCGIPDVDLQYLKLHTTYHVGLMEEDQHIKYFWNTLESFSQEEMRKFIKFACNQERIPFGEPCRGSTDTVMNVPPYPMKIAPPDGTDPPDTRYIRAETCMFLIKLPQYSCQSLMTERLKYAINCREDPLSG